MRYSIAATLLLCSSLTTGLVQRANRHACPLLGQQYPPPVQLSTNSKFKVATASIDAALNRAVLKAPYKDSTFSIGFFSTSEDDLLYQYHHTGNAVKNSSYGTRSVDADSIYRIGSISKLLTIYVWLINQGESGFSTPIGEILPQLKQTSERSWNPLTPNWTEITIGDLAGQMGGLGRDYGLADLAPPKNGLVALPQSLRTAFPHLPQAEVPICGYLTANYSFVECTVDDYLSGVADESPIFPAAYTPVYSNEAFALIGLALAKVSGTAVESLFNDTFAKPLGLSSTYYSPPKRITENDVIPGSPLGTGWINDFGVFAPAGGYYSTVNDFATMGKAILTSKLLPQALTNRWLKPTSFVEDFAQGVGRPWEIYRLKVNGQSVDMYTKGGDWGDYHTIIALVPQYNFGFTVMEAGLGGVRDDAPNLLADTILPIIDQIARDQAEINFSGHYAAKQGNSSITLTTAGPDSGLKIIQWISNGVDVLTFLKSLVPDLVFRLQPNQLGSGNNTVGFTGYYSSSTPPPKNGTFLFNCPGWFGVDGIPYGNIPLGQMVFNLDNTSSALSVELRSLRITLNRQSRTL